VSAIGTEGPGAAIETASPMPLGQGTVLLLGKSEYARFQQRAGFTDQKAYSSFNTVAVGLGVLPWLSVFAFQPYNVKAQDGRGTSAGPGDTNLMLSASLKWDEGLLLAPEKESLDDLEDWHLGVWAACSLPVGVTENRDRSGTSYAPDMQTGFRGPSPSAGVSVLKQVARDVTVLGEVGYQHFFDRRYPAAGYRYQFGAETRVSAAAVFRTWASGRYRIDVPLELSALNLQRDREDGVALRGSGGTVLYGLLGVRAILGPVSLAASVKRAVATWLNESAQQQGSEGLESYRVAFVAGYATRL
jgi:hypothetical protein